MKRLSTIFIYLFFSMTAIAQSILPLYSDSIPNARPCPDKESYSREGEHQILIIHSVSRPTLTVYLPPTGSANRTAVIICPGGGYSILAASHEGSDVALRLNDWGITAFVLKYRIPDDSTMVNKEIGPLQDAQRAIQLVRERSAEFGIDPGKIGIMGFSAGGHLASTAGTHFSPSLISNKQLTSLRPDFMILIYPVISFTDSIGHLGSRDNLIGKHPSPEKIRAYSNELQVNAGTPPAFLVHAEDDEVVKVENSIYFFEAERTYKIPAEMHIYPKGGHGFGMNEPFTKDQWMDRLKNWLSASGFL